MQLDPTRWLVSFAGFVADWAISREWKRILFSMLPLFFLAFVGGMVFWGSRLDKSKLASWYMELGEQEIAEWQNSWAAVPTTESVAKPDAGKDAVAKSADVKPEDASADNGEESSENKERSPAAPKQISRFAEVLFRRVQLLEPNNRSQFVIGVTLAQRGAVGQALRMLNKIAPDDRAGYAPAHAWLAQVMLSQPITRENLPAVKHHIEQAVKWERVPEQVLIGGSQIFWILGEPDQSLRYTERAFDRNPEHYTLLVRQAKEAKKPLIIEQASKKAEVIFRSKLETNERDIKARVMLASVLADSNRLDETEQLLRDGLKIDQSADFIRGISEVYRLRFVSSLKYDGTDWSGNLEFLEQAIRIDPTNALAVEEIAKLARLTGKSPGEELFETLRQSLAEGKATAVTHAWISELYLIRKDYARALPHLEQVVNRLPNAAQYANNLAFVLSQIAPKRLEEALKLAERAVALEPTKADYSDTLGVVLAKQERYSEAITAIESAVASQPARVDFHERLVALYDKTQNTEMAAQHRAVITKINAAKIEQETAPSKETAAENQEVTKTEDVAAESEGLAPATQTAELEKQSITPGNQQAAPENEDSAPESVQPAIAAEDEEKAGT